MRLLLSAAFAGVFTLACGSDSPGANTTGGSGGSGLGGSGGNGGVSAASSNASGGAAGEMNQAGASGAGNEGGGSGFDSCATSEQQGVQTPANLLFVIDRSGSMNCNAPETGQSSASCETTPRKQFPEEPSKWEVVNEALSSALTGLIGRSHVSAGVVVFPKSDPDNECAVSVAPDVAIATLTGAHKRDIDGYLTDVVPAGRTPIAGSTITSFQYLADALRAGDLAGNTFVVLLTDGSDTCDGEQRPEILDEFVETHVPNATEFNISTFVIGAPGSEGERRLLSRIAWAGNTAADPGCDHEASEADVGDCHFDMTTTDDFADELSQALSRITDNRALSCAFDVPKGQAGRTVDLNKVNVEFTSSGGNTRTIVRDTRDCAESANGWQYSSDYSQILLCGNACDRVKADPGGEVNILLGCKTEEIK